MVPISANCADRLQPMDLSANKSAKELMHGKFREWYATQVQKQLDEGVSQISPCSRPLDVHHETPWSSGWLVSLYDYIKEHNSLILKQLAYCNMQLRSLVHMFTVYHII